MTAKNSAPSSSVKKLDLLLQLTSQINSDLDLKKVLINIIDAAKKITESEACSVFLKDEQRDELILSVPSGPTADLLSGKRISMDQGIAGWVARNAKAQIINNVSDDERFHGDFNPDRFITQNMICVPLIKRDGSVVGVLQAMNKKDRSNYEDNEVPIFSALADQAAIAINNAQLNEERNALMGEIHHRVRNNMATISAIMQLQSLMAESEDLRKILLYNITRISSMATIHDAMYGSESFSKINFSDSLQTVVSKSIQTLGNSQKFDVSYNCEPVTLNVNQCIPLSMIVNEVLLNIETENGNNSNLKLKFNLKENKKTGSVRLEITDNGTTIDGYTNKSDRDHFQFIEVIRQQMNAECSYKPGDEENRFTISFEKSDKKGTANYGM